MSHCSSFLSQFLSACPYEVRNIIYKKLHNYFISGFDGIQPRAPLVNYLERQHIMRYIFAGRFLRPTDMVLDVACGCGYGTHYLSQVASSGHVYGVDTSTDALKQAGRYKDRDNLEYLPGDALSLPFRDATFDVVISFETIEHLDDFHTFLTEIKRVLRPEGVFICSTPNKAYSLHPPYHRHEFYPEEFYTLIENYFPNTYRYYQEEIFKNKLYLALYYCRTMLQLRAASRLGNTVFITPLYKITPGIYFSSERVKKSLPGEERPAAIMIAVAGRRCGQRKEQST